MPFNEYTDFVVNYPGSDTVTLERSVKRIKDEAHELYQELKGNQNRISVLLELGDVLFFIGRAAHSMGYTLEDVAIGNHLKLTHRAKYGKNTKKEKEYVRDRFESNKS